MDSRIDILPKQPGVYIMRSKDGTIIYIGKAKNLSDRVKQYFQESNLYSRGWKLPSLLPLIAKIDYVTCASERDALVLEEKLIKQYQPFFNSLKIFQGFRLYVKVPPMPVSAAVTPIMVLIPNHIL